MRRLITAFLLALACAPVAVAHEGSPNFLSEIDGVQPAMEGVRLEMLSRDDRIELENRSGKDVVILGYDDEPYARLKADGTVEVNTNSKAYYLNEDRFGTSEVPETLPSEPEWKELSKAGRFEWHDHRAHYMGKGRPPQVKDPGKRQKVFDWEVPMQAGGTPAAITGTLFWTPEESASSGLYIGGGVLCLLIIAGALLIRRRRSQPGDGAAEAW
jgi:MYXO-CTERM domain-containing protein